MSVDTSRYPDPGRHSPTTIEISRRMGRQRISPPRLRLLTSERRVLLALMDIALINVALLATWTLRFGGQASPLTLLAPVKWYVTLTVVWVLVALFFDLYDLARAASTTAIVRSASAAVFVAVLVYTFIPRLTPPLMSRGAPFLFAGMAWVLVVGWRVIYSQLFVQPWFKQRALVVGAGWAGRTLAEAMQMAPHDANPYRGTGYQFLGFIDDNCDLHGGRIQGIPVLGGRDVLVPMAQALNVDEIIVAITHRHAIADELFDDLLRCRELGMRITTMSELYERLLARVPVQHVGRDLSTVLPQSDTVGQRFFAVGKRAGDIATSLLGLAVLMLVAPLVALANAYSSPGPLFYYQRRVGRHGRVFQCIKFRSMIPNAEQHTGAVWCKADDCRITPVGRFLRMTRLDELPQFINVLRGEMSVVGPRPERPEFVEDLARTIPFYRARHAVRPGITGWAQVQYRYGNTVDDARVKLEYDLYYVKNANLLLELRILLKTASVMLQFKGQ